MNVHTVYLNVCFKLSARVNSVSPYSHFVSYLVSYLEVLWLRDLSSSGSCWGQIRSNGIAYRAKAEGTVYVLGGWSL